MIIKFRGWNKALHRMLSAIELCQEQNALTPLGRLSDVTPRRYVSIVYELDDFIPLQYTGLNDKNGKECYVGDILKHSRGGYTQEWFYVVENIIDIHIEMNDKDHYSRMDDAFEIVGNIYQNPELIPPRN